MPPLNNRDHHESELAAAIAGAHETALRRILSALGSVPDDSRLNEAFWAGIATLYIQAVKQPLKDIYLEAADQMSSDFESDVDSEDAAATWADEYSQTLGAQLAKTREETVKEAVRQSKVNTWDHQHFIDALMAAFSVVNAGMIAVTEATNATSEGQKGYAGAFAALTGVTLTPVIQNDFDPCEDICQPKQGQNPFEVGFSPFHPSCRCYEDWTK